MTSFIRIVLSIHVIFLLFYYSAQSQNAAEMEAALEKVSGAEKIQLLNDLTWELSFTDFDKAIVYGEKAIKMAEELKDFYLLSDAYNSISNAYYMKGRYDMSISINKSALEIRKELNDSLGMASSYSKLGMGYFEINEYEKSLENHLEALKIWEHFNHAMGIGYTLNNMGSVYKVLRQYEKARESHLLAANMAKERGDDYGVAKALGNLAIIYQYQEKYDSAIDANLQALEIFEQYNSEVDLSVIYLNLGVLYRTMEQTDKGHEYYLKAYELSVKIDDKNSMAYSLSNLGYINISLGNYDKADEFFKASYELSKEINVKNIMFKSLLGTLEVILLKNNLKYAVPMMEEMIALKDSIYDEESGRAIADMQTKYETEKKEQEIALKNLEIEKQEAELSRRNVLLFSALAFIVVIMALAYLIYNRQKLKQKNLETELTLKEALAHRKLLEKIQEERLRISRDLHDSLGAELTLISSSADNSAVMTEDPTTKQNFDEISDISRNSVNILRDTIWAIRKDTLDVEEFTLKLRQFVEQRKSSIQVAFQNDIKENVLLTPSQSLHLFRVCQEVIHNAIKHADCNEMKVHFYNDEQNMFVVLKDDGKGFAKERKDGYGLRNMQERIQEINGQIKIDSEIGKGTRVAIAIPREI
jgi:signal transduction histidine kinase